MNYYLSRETRYDKVIDELKEKFKGFSSSEAEEWLTSDSDSDVDSTKKED